MFSSEQTESKLWLLWMLSESSRFDEKLVRRLKENVWRINYLNGFKSKPNEILLDCLLYDHFFNSFTFMNFIWIFLIVSFFEIFWNNFDFFVWIFTRFFLIWFFVSISANSQSNERLSSTEARSTAIASSSNNARTIIGNVLNTANPTTYKSPTKSTTKENFDEGNEANGGADDDDDLSSDQLHLMLEPHLRPKPPDPNSDLSKQIYDEHKQLAKEYLKVASSLLASLKFHLLITLLFFIFFRI